MPVFEFKGFDSGGKATKGVREADSAKGLRAVLRREGVMVTEVKASGRGARGKATQGTSPEKKGLLDREVEFTFLQRVSVEELGIATRQLATLLQAGVTMVESLTAIIDQIENKAFKRIFAHIKDDVNEGASLADALAKHKIFDHVYVNMVRAGESSGTLDLVLERLADFKEGQARLKGEVLGTMMYPVIMIFVGVGIMGVLLTVVVPRITRIFEHANAQLPIQTKILITISNFARDYWWLALLMAVAGGFLLKRWIATPKGRATWDRISLRLPIFGGLFRMIAVARFARTLGTLLNAGVSLLISLDIVRNVVSNDVIARAIDATKDAVREGEDIATPLKRSAQFPPMVVHMVAIGEKSGQLEGMLNRVATSFEHRVETRLKTLTSLLEPVMILGMAGVVGFIVFSILMPILQMNTLVR
ncbi:MAG: type II secretion system inner membrane protein GspF [Myxococcota bacterium]